MPIKRSCPLAACEDGDVSFAVNGRLGRRVACILDSQRLVLQVLDMEGSDPDEDEDAAGEEVR